MLDFVKKLKGLVRKPKEDSTPEAPPFSEGDIGFRSMQVKPGEVELELTLSQKLAANLVYAFKDQLKEAKNYVEMSLYHPGEGMYCVTILRPGGKTPSQLMKEAQAEVSSLKGLLEELSDMACGCGFHVDATPHCEVHERINHVLDSWGDV